MSQHRKQEKQFLLKDLLFNEGKVKQLASEIKNVYVEFPDKDFVKISVQKFPELELKERIDHLATCLSLTLPNSYRDALEIILKALPEPLSLEKEDNDFGDFIYAPYGAFVAKYGCTKEDVKVSLLALEEITKRFSMEFALRDFINLFPKETLPLIKHWTKSDNYHVRRLASEGTRPFLPWAKKISCDPLTFLPILEELASDQTTYVVRSVANHLNDISKVEGEVVLNTLVRLEKFGRVRKERMEYLKKQALRTLVKQGDEQTLKFLGYSSQLEISLKLKLQNKKVLIGESLHFELFVHNQDRQDLNLLLDYEIIFAGKAEGGAKRMKVFKIKNLKLTEGEKFSVAKIHSFKLITTRTYYTGRHELRVRGNGQVLAEAEFTLIAE